MLGRILGPKHTVESVAEKVVEILEQEVSDMRKKVAFITASDLHFSQEPPKARAEKGDDWLKVQWRHMEALAEWKAKYDCEVVYAGDIFNTWKEPAEVVNLVIQNLPRGFAIPGQHDLPYHRYEDKTKSPYWTLVRAGVLEDLPPGQLRMFNTKSGKLVNLYGFPWGSKVTRPERAEQTLKVAVIHSYVWNDASTAYENAPFEANVRRWGDRLHGYDVAVFGDNHKGFARTLLADGHDGPKINVLNNGHFIPRVRGEGLGSVGIVYENGGVERIPLADVDAQWEEEDKIFRPDDDFTSEELEQLMRVLRKSTAAKVDFANILLRSLSDSAVGKLARDVIVKALEESR